MRTLYHYCSVESFFKIIESKSIWLSNCGQMNDSRETTWIESYFDLIKEIFKNGNHSDFEKNTIITYTWNKKETFIFCLSENRDSLSQWRAYSNDGKGICIGFNFEKLGLENKIPSRNVHKDNTIGIQKIEYSKVKQKKKILNTVEDFIETFEKKEEKYWEVSSSFLAFQLVNFSLIYKNPSFAEEKEWRIIHTPLEKENEYESKDVKIKISELNFRVSGNKMTSYAALNLKSKFDSQLIPEIILGPKCEIDSQILENFLESNNLSETKIIYSASTYR